MTELSLSFSKTSPARVAPSLPCGPKKFIEDADSFDPTNPNRIKPVKASKDSPEFYLVFQSETWRCRNGTLFRVQILMRNYLR
jgi:hypothetical protein